MSKKRKIFGKEFNKSKTGERSMHRHVDNVRDNQIEYLRSEVQRLKKLNKEAGRKH